MELKKTWARQGSALFLGDVSTNEDALAKAIYVLSVTPKGQLYLDQISDSYEFDFKIYGLERPFIDKVKKTYANTTGNLGVLLNGIKGTGKTITAEIIANELELPIILINEAHEGTNSFLASIRQDITIFIDEYEKVYKGNIGDSYDDDDIKVAGGDSSLLSLMDGTFKTEFRKVFLLTTNRMWINENMLNRPGRIRYLKQFGDLTKDQILEIIDDCLNDKTYTEELLDFLKPLKIITVDIVKNIIQEINIFDESPAVCCKDFNVEMKDETYSIVQVKDDKEEVLAEDYPVHYKNNFEKTAKNGKAYLEWGSVYVKMTGKITNGVYPVEDVHGEKGKFNIKFKKEKSYHSVFAAF